jgi:hypothetical protein
LLRVVTVDIEFLPSFVLFILEIAIIRVQKRKMENKIGKSFFFSRTKNIVRHVLLLLLLKREREREREREGEEKSDNCVKSSH